MIETEQLAYPISDSEFLKLKTLLYEVSGIALSDHKKSMVVSRLSRRLRILEMSSFAAYLDYIDKTSGESGEKDELVQMLDLLSTNKTDFFREQHHFDFLSERILKDRRASQPIRIWSAACSSGEEPYSIAMTVYDAFSSQQRPDILSPSCKILASDLSTRVLDQAASGIYKMEGVRNLELPQLKRHFLKGSGVQEGCVKVKKHLSTLVSFKRINLMDDCFPIKTPLDVIFCRNVMIYFDRPTQECLIGKFHHVLKPGGVLFIGHSESLNWIQHQFKMLEPTIYQKEID